MPLWACGGPGVDGDPGIPEELFDEIFLATATDHLGVPTRFDPNLVVAERLFVQADALDGDRLQAFLEDNPFSGRSWLADERVGDERFADVLAHVAHRRGINPLMLLARLQVEQGLVSPTVRPSSQRRIDFALGCGCPDNSGCSESFRGIDRQLDCSAETHEELHRVSVDGSGAWRFGHARKTLDGAWITPANHATAALYAYTPWKLNGEGGNSLLWRILKSFVLHLSDKGLMAPLAPLAGLDVRWHRLEDGAVRFESRSPDAEITTLEIAVDDYVIGKSDDRDGGFPIEWTFRGTSENRRLVAKGYDRAGLLVARSSGTIDTDLEAPWIFIRPSGAQQLEVGIEGAGPDVASITVKWGDRVLRDEVTQLLMSPRMAVRFALPSDAAEEMSFTVTAHDISGLELFTERRTYAIE